MTATADHFKQICTHILIYFFSVCILWNINYFKNLDVTFQVGIYTRTYVLLTYVVVVAVAEFVCNNKKNFIVLLTFQCQLVQLSKFVSLLFRRCISSISSCFQRVLFCLQCFCNRENVFFCNIGIVAF